MTQSEFVLACQKSLSQEWFPTTPFDFLALARTTSEYPNSRTAFQLACQNEGMTADVKKPYDHAVIYETVKRLGSHALKNADDRYFATWDEVYQQVISEHKNGSDFTLPESQQLEHKHIPADKSVADRELEKMFALMGKRAVA